MKSRVAVTTALAMCLASTAIAQERKAFEVASIKSNKSDSGSSSWQTSHERMTFTNATMATIFKAAFELKDYQFSAPDWFNNERYDIVAKGPDGTRETDLSAMLQSLLLDRFKLTFHTEQREVAAFGLVVDKGGLKITPLQDGEVFTGSSSSGSNSTPGFTTMSTTGSLASFASSLANNIDVQRPVADLTNLPGQYKIALRYIAFSRQTPDNNGPTIFTALQEQVGLKLEPRREWIKFFVVDHAEKTPLEP
jgi:uncharacterized protein (TIGR03435 family)